MNIKTRTLLPLLGLAAAVAFAQGGNGPRGPGNAPRSGAGLDMAKQQTIEGSISLVQIAYGAQYPSIVVNKTQIKVAPVWYLLESDFELSVGETVRVTTAPSNTADDQYLYAIDITKISGGAKIVLRDAAGIPLWLGAARRGGNPQAPVSGGGCLDTASTRTVTGIIDRVTLGVGIQHPTLVLKTADALLTIELGPERILLGSDLELTPGSSLTVKHAQSTCTDEYVALELTDAKGNTLILRHDGGTPGWHD